MRQCNSHHLLYQLQTGRVLHLDQQSAQTASLRQSGLYQQQFQYVHLVLHIIVHLEETGK